jgi:type I restriction enzyme R subunit
MQSHRPRQPRHFASSHPRREQDRNGEIVDYYNVFRNMKKALAEYAIGSEGADEMPVQDKKKLFNLLDDAIEQTLAFCGPKEIDLKSLLDKKEVFKKLGRFEAFANILLSKDEWYKEFFVHENIVTGFYEACKPEIYKKPRRAVFAIQYLREVIEARINRQDVDKVSLRISRLLDESVAASDKKQLAESQIIKAGKTWDLSKVDIDKLKAEFSKSEFKFIEIADLRAFIEGKLQQMLERNITRVDFAERYQGIVNQYNAGGTATEVSFEELINFANDLNTEEERHIREGLTEEELELFDLMRKEKITKAEELALKNAAKMLLKRLREEKPVVLVQNWEKDFQSQTKVKSAIEETLDQNLPAGYDRLSFKQVCDRIYNLIFERAVQGMA